MADLIDPKEFGCDVNQLFPTNIIAFENKQPDAEKFNKAIAEYVLEQAEENQDEQGRHSVGGQDSWHSEKNLHELDYWWSDNLESLIMTSVAAYGNGSVPKDFEIACWAVLIRKGGYSNYHTHPNNIISGVYYVDVPEDIEIDKNRTIGGIIQFPDTRAGACGTSHESATWGYKPQESSGLIFPSWVPHFVSPYMGESYRISLSWNVVF